MSEINVVPYIDVMLVLLVIFMITAPLLSQGVNVNLPQASAQPLKEQDKQPIIVSVDREGLYYLSTASNAEEALPLSTITQQVANDLGLANQQGETRSVFVKGDAAVDYGKVIQAMAMLQQAGVSQVGLITNPAPDMKGTG